MSSTSKLSYSSTAAAAAAAADNATTDKNHQYTSARFYIKGNERPLMPPPRLNISISDSEILQTVKLLKHQLHDTRNAILADRGMVPDNNSLHVVDMVWDSWEALKEWMNGKVEVKYAPVMYNWLTPEEALKALPQHMAIMQKNPDFVAMCMGMLTYATVMPDEDYA
jgi:hypothetical protein